MIRLKDFLNLVAPSVMLQIIKDEKPLYTGYMPLPGRESAVEAEMDAEVKRFAAVPEIRHRQWQEKGLMAPIQPEEMPQYKFSDLQMTLYYTIYI